MARVISIISLDRGNGKTTVALNLGLALHQKNRRVLVFDADFTKNNMIEHLSVSSLPVTIKQVLDNKAHMNEAIYRHITGLKLIPSIIHDYNNFSYYFEDLLADYDYIILDTPKEVSLLDVVLKNSDEAMIVHSPTYSSKIVADAIDMLSRRGIMNLGIIMNNSADNSADALLDYPVIMKIPTDKYISKSFEMKNPVVHTHPGSNAARKFRILAEMLL